VHASRPSDTATLIARSILLASHDPGLKRLVAKDEPDILKRVLAALQRRNGFSSALEIGAIRRFLLKCERFLLPGIISHYLARKREIEAEVKTSITEGSQRIVVLGAGFDTLAWRLHQEYPQVQFIELDHPATQKVKRRALGETANFSLQAIDLASQNPSAVLSDDVPTTFVLEGLTMYLRPERVSAILSDLAQLAGTTGSIVFTFMECDDHGSIGFRGENPLIARWLSARREPFLWGISRKKLSAFLQASGIDQFKLSDHQQLRRNHLIPRDIDHLPLAEGEILCIAKPANELECNDKHSKLNPTRVAKVHRPESEEEVMASIRQAAAEHQAVSICGARHAMGGQQFGAGTHLIDLSKLTELHPVDYRQGLVEAGAGIMWQELIEGLHNQQSGRETVWSIRQKQTGADDLTLGGALAANVHGRGLRMRPFIDDVEAFTLIDGDGTRHRCSRNQNSELFRLAIGGYGCFGVITSVLLRLTPRRKMERLVELTTIENLIPAFNERIASGCLYGDFQFSIDETSPDFLHCGVLSCYCPVDPSTPIPESRRELDANDWEELIDLAHHDRAKAFRIYSDFYLSTHKAIYWSDTHQLSVYLNDYHSKLDHQCGAATTASEMISELYVPREHLSAFMRSAAKRLRDGLVPVIYGTVRLIQRDDESFLAWAREDYACIIFNLHTEHSEDGIVRSSDAFRALIDLALSFGGSYYLTYHRWARRDQVEKAHPRFRAFLEKKEQLDPSHRFQSEWWRHHRRLFEISSPMVKPRKHRVN
jgi:methyltransferase (TIGR00027 family)